MTFEQNCPQCGHDHAWCDPDDPCEDYVKVNRHNLELLYACAKEYDVRIPRDGHNLWAAEFFKLFETPASAEEER